MGGQLAPTQYTLGEGPTGRHTRYIVVVHSVCIVGARRTGATSKRTEKVGYEEWEQRWPEGCAADPMVLGGGLHD